MAILSRVGLSEVVANFAPGSGPPDPDARIITARCAGVLVANVYVPNGRSLDNPHYEYKLAWLDQPHRHVGELTTADDNVIVAGDFNIAPADIDVYDPAKFVGATHTSPAERERLAALGAWGLTDVFRRHHPDAQLFSWWTTAPVTSIRVVACDISPGHGQRLGGGAQRIRRDRPQRPQGPVAVRPRPGDRRPGRAAATCSIPAAHTRPRPTIRWPTPPTTTAPPCGAPPTWSAGRWRRWSTTTVQDRRRGPRRGPRMSITMPHFRDYGPFTGRFSPMAPPSTSSQHDDHVEGAVVTAGPSRGLPGFVHGGFVAAGFDEALGFAQALGRL